MLTGWPAYEETVGQSVAGMSRECKIEKILCVDPTLSDLYAINIQTLVYWKI